MGMTIERKDNSKGYDPENCVWATPKCQHRNKRTNLVFTFKGITACLCELCERFGIEYSVVIQRVRKYGWDIDRALTIPKSYRKPRATV